jgi:hypothetical protein
LHAPSAHERWDGFWCVSDERYYTRCRQLDGREQWYRIADASTSLTPAHVRESRVLPLRPRRIAAPDGRVVLSRDARRTLLFVSVRSCGRDILVGSSRNRTRSRPRRAGDSF